MFKINRLTGLVVAGLVSLTAASATAQSQTGALMNENFQQADGNNDGFLYLSEFVTFVDLAAQSGLGRAERIASSQNYSRAFSEIDANGDGAVTREELRALSQRQSQ